MMATLLFVATILLVRGENDYADLGIVLPRPLFSHISAIYDDKLFIFGGRNSSTQYNVQYFRISLKNKFTANAEYDDITSSLSNDDWEVLDVSAPNYGPNTDNTFWCESQCSAVIGKYLYIVGAFSKAGIAVTNTVYRLDLSLDTPVFAAQDDFPSTQGFAIPARQSCVVAINDILYTTNGVPYNGQLTSYDPETKTQTRLANNTEAFSSGRRDAACVANVGKSALYLLSGRTQEFTYGSPFIDYYTISSNEWTAFVDYADRDLCGSAQNCPGNLRCKTSLYGNTAECPGGLLITPRSTSLIYNLGESTYSTVNLFDAVAYAAVEQYEFYNDESRGAFLMLVVGGETDGNNVPTDLIQYSVRSSLLTDAPSASPIQAPTADTTDPTKAPSRSPLCAGCTFKPTESPTTPAPVESDNPPDDDSKAGMVCMVIACIMGILSVVIV